MIDLKGFLVQLTGALLQQGVKPFLIELTGQFSLTR